MRRVGAAFVVGVVVAGCAEPAGPRVSQGDVALCVYMRDAAPVVFNRDLDRLLADATDGQLIGLASASRAKLKGSPERNAAVARCRAIGAL